jgi:hypothetical protein
MSDFIVNQVYCTTEYDKFKTLEGNREVRINNLMRLRRSLSEKQLQSPIIVNEVFQIIDGQHRHKIIQELKLPLFYIIMNGYGLKECQRLNANSTNWTQMDFVKGYVDLGYTEYIKIDKFMKMFPDFAHFQIYKYLLQGTCTNSSRSSEDKMKMGTFEVPNFEESVSNARKMMDFKVCFNAWGHVSFMQAVFNLIKLDKYNHERMMQKLEYLSAKIVRCPRNNDYYDLFTDVYNYKIVNREKINFKYELSLINKGQNYGEFKIAN